MLSRFAFVSVAVVLCAQQGHTTESHEEHEAHVHGMAELNIAVEGNQLEIELISPAMNIVGFEHAPSDGEQEAAIAKAMEIFEDGERVFAAPEAAGCSLAMVETTDTSGEAGGTSTEAEEGHHEEGEHEEHGHGEVHSEFHAEYSFECSTPEQLSHVDVLVFELFPGTEEIESQVITPAGQSAQALSADFARISLK